MATAGVVFLPGMMKGQILGGQAQSLQSSTRFQS
nr:ABC transporter permease [Methanosarcina acetivorans]